MSEGVLVKDEGGGEVEGDTGESGEGVTNDGTIKTGVASRNDPTIQDTPTNKGGTSDSATVATQKGVSPYQLVFMEDLSSESSMAGSVSPQNLEISGSFTPAAATRRSEVVGSEVRGAGEEMREDQEEVRSTVSSSTVVAESIVSCDTVDTAREVSAKREDEGEITGAGPRDEMDGQTKGDDRGTSPSEVVIDDRADSVTPPPKPKEHALSRFTSDSEAGDMVPPFSPLEYNSSEEDARHTPSFPLPTPSPLPPGSDSPFEDQPAMSILFSGVFYLGSSTVDAPISETEANRKMNILHEQALSSQPMPIILSVPITNDGSVLLKDPKTDQLLTTFPVKMILFCVRGGDESMQDCFCLNVRHKRSGTYHCHVFRCDIQEAVSIQYVHR